MNRLTGKQNRYLRSLGHTLKPAAMVGKEGVSESVVTSVNESLDAHELIKVRVQEGFEGGTREAADRLAESTGALVAQRIGKTFLLYRESPKKKLRLP